MNDNRWKTHMFLEFRALSSKAMAHMMWLHREALNFWTTDEV